MRRTLTKAELPESTLTTGISLYCRRCHEHYSAQHGDYFAVEDSTPMICGECETPLVLARKVMAIHEAARG